MEYDDAAALDVDDADVAAAAAAAVTVADAAAHDANVGDTEDEDDAGDDDASQAPAFLAGCGHWTNIHFEMGLPTTPIHCLYFVLCTISHCKLYFDALYLAAVNS